MDGPTIAGGKAEAAALRRRGAVRDRLAAVGGPSVSPARACGSDDLLNPVLRYEIDAFARDRRRPEDSADAPQAPFRRMACSAASKEASVWIAFLDSLSSTPERLAPQSRLRSSVYAASTVGVTRARMRCRAALLVGR